MDGWVFFEEVEVVGMEGGGVEEVRCDEGDGVEGGGVEGHQCGINVFLLCYNIEFQ